MWLVWHKLVLCVLSSVSMAEVVVGSFLLNVVTMAKVDFGFFLRNVFCVAKVFVVCVCVFLMWSVWEMLLLSVFS